MNKPLYEQDVVLWSAEQANALRAAGAARINTPSPIDWENVAEEIDSLGASQRSELRSRIRVVIQHLMKSQAWPATAPRPGWIETVLTQRAEIQDLLNDSPSLRREVAGIVSAELQGARRTVASVLEAYGERSRVDLAALAYLEGEVVGEWLPEPP